MSPFGNGFVEFTRMNCSRCSCSSPVMKATTQIGKLSMWAARIAAMPLLSIDDPPWAVSVGEVRLHGDHERADARVLGPSILCR